ncbi:hypothetical protein AYI68_g6518 [Smittium mucronatum]|uniref:Uncharacterized protein n=1 Tax=Smittium mucronatum TaxID=133383 RepID=A0A1R0GRA2_9FUNG|nr:hypothetical protein AYI68_g6518 [Smittium mucronatum]
MEQFGVKDINEYDAVGAKCISCQGYRFYEDFYSVDGSGEVIFTKDKNENLYVHGINNYKKKYDCNLFNEVFFIGFFTPVSLYSEWITLSVDLEILDLKISTLLKPFPHGGIKNFDDQQAFQNKAMELGKHLKKHKAEIDLKKTQKENGMALLAIKKISEKSL